MLQSISFAATCLILNVELSANRRFFPPMHIPNKNQRQILRWERILMLHMLPMWAIILTAPTTNPQCHQWNLYLLLYEYQRPLRQCWEPAFTVTFNGKYGDIATKEEQYKYSFSCYSSSLKVKVTKMLNTKLSFTTYKLFQLGKIWWACRNLSTYLKEFVQHCEKLFSI